MIEVPAPSEKPSPDPAAGLIDSAVLAKETSAFSSAREERRTLFPRAVAVGVIAGLLAVGFRYALALSETARNLFIAWAHHISGVGWLITFAFSAALTTLAVLLVRLFAPEAAGSGIPYVEAVLLGYRELPWKRILPIKFFGGLLAIGSGLALGREGPTIQMGACVGEALSSSGKSGTRAKRTLIAAGSGAGLAAAFNAPLAGLVFVLEELQKDFRPNVLGAAFLASASADIVSRFIGGQLPAITAPTFAMPPLALLPAFAVLGVVCGLFGVLFNKGLMATISGYEKLFKRFGIWPAALMGGLIGIVAFFAPAWVGAGHGLAEDALAGKIAFGIIPLLIVLRLGMTLGSYGTGAAGGIFAPFLALAAILGLGGGLLVQRYAPGLHDIVPGTFAAIAMAAMFTAIVRTPLTGIVLIVEMTASYSLMLPLLVACLAAYLVGEALKDMPIYEALLQRDLSKGGLAPEDDDEAGEAFEVTVVVQSGSAFDGVSVRDLGLPKGILLVSIGEGGKESVPDANTRLRAHMKVRAVVSPNARAGVEALRLGAHKSTHAGHSVNSH